MRLILDTHIQHKRDFLGVCWLNRTSTIRHLYTMNLLCDSYTSLLSFRTVRDVR